MSWKYEKTSPTQIAITATSPYGELELLLPKAAEAIANEIEIEGFRKGKAPYEIVKQKLGEFKILEEAARMHIRDNFEKILKEVGEKEFEGKSFEPVGEPNIAITKLALGEDLEYKITLFLLPSVELPDYKAIAEKILAAKKVPAVEESEVEKAKNWLRESRTKLITVNRAAEENDRAEIDYEGRIGGIKAEGLESKNHPLVIGQKRFIPGFEENLIGMKAGEEKTFSLAAPADYGAKGLAGKNIEFKVKMNLVEKREVPEWGDEFAKSLGNFGSAKDVEAGIREGLRTEKEERERERVRMAIVEAIAEKTKVDVPAPLIENELEKMVAELAQSVGQMGLKFEDYLMRLKKTAEDLKKEWRNGAEKRVRIALVLREIAGKEKITPSDEEIQRAINRTAAHQGLGEEDVKKIDPVRGKSPAATAAPSARASNGVDREAFINYNRGVARNEKVFAWLENL